MEIRQSKIKMATGTQLGDTATSVPAQAGVAGRFGAFVTRARARWAALRPNQRLWAACAAGLVSALLGGLLWFGLRTDWRTLYAGLDPEDARHIAQILSQAQIPFDIAAGGETIRVPVPQLAKARLAVAAKGFVTSGPPGFELFDRPHWVGSGFDEQVNYQRALEGELEHVVAAFADVESARIHLAMPHDSLFRDQERPAKALVVLKLKHPLLAGEPDAIRNLVASAVDGLTAERVDLFDASRNLPFGPKSADALRLTAEQALEEKILFTLEPVTGVGNVRASVTLEYDQRARTVRHVVETPGRLRRLTAAIVVNDRLTQAAGKDTAAIWQPRSAEELRNLTALARAAVGFDSSRGDLLTVEDISFNANHARMPPTPSRRSAPVAEDSLLLIKYGAILAGIAAILAFGVRPAVHRISALKARSPEAPRTKVEGDPAQPPLKPPGQAELDPEKKRSREILEQVADHLKREPSQSSRLLQSWIRQE